MTTSSNLNAFEFKFDGWKATAVLLGIWLAPAIVGFILGVLVAR